MSEGYSLTKKVSVVFCGQIRRQTYMTQAVIHMANLRRAGVVEQIVVSTWAGELDHYPEMRALLHESGVLLVEVAPLSSGLVSVGNIERQVLLLHWGMMALDDSENYVFKTRPDQPINLFPRLGELFASMIAKVGLRDDADGALWVPRYHALIPFFIDDRYFFGHRHTVERMTTFSNELVITGHPHNLIAEVIWYASYFIRKYPYLRRMMQVDWSPPWPDGDFYPILDRVRDQPLFRQSMALYYYCLDTYFKVGFDGIGLKDFAGLQPQPLGIEIPENDTYHLQCRQAVFEHFDLWEDYREVTAAGSKLSLASPERAFDDYDAAMLNHGKFIYRPRIFGGVHEIDQAAATNSEMPGRVGYFVDGTPIGLEQVTLSVRTQAHLPQREPIDVRVTINNKNTSPLPANATCPLKLGYRWFRAGVPVWDEFPRIIVEQRVVSFLEIAFTIIAPPLLGQHELEVDLLYDGLFWFDRPSRVSVEVV
jgi:hypothetical protein